MVEGPPSEWPYLIVNPKERGLASPSLGSSLDKQEWLLHFQTHKRNKKAYKGRGPVWTNPYFLVHTNIWSKRGICYMKSERNPLSFSEEYLAFPSRDIYPLHFTSFQEWLGPCLIKNIWSEICPFNFRFSFILSAWDWDELESKPRTRQKSPTSFQFWFWFYFVGDTSLILL